MEIEVEGLSGGLILKEMGVFLMREFVEIENRRQVGYRVFYK